MLAQRSFCRLKRVVVSLSAVVGLLGNAAYAQVSPQDVDATLGKINQVLTKPNKLLDGHSAEGETKQEETSHPTLPLTSKTYPAGQVRVYDNNEPQAGKLDQSPVTLNGEETEDPEQEKATLNDALKASVTKTETYPVTLDVVLRLVEEQNLPLHIDRLTTSLQKNTFYRSLSNLLPDVGSSYQQSRFVGGQQVLSQVSTIKRIQFSPQISASWTIKPGGEDLFTALAAKRRYTESKSLLQTTLQEQLSGAAQDYYNLLEAQTQVENIQIGIEEAQTQVGLNDSRLQAGVGTKLDLMRAKSQLVQKQRDLITAESNRAKMEQALLNRLNMDTEVSLSTEGATVQPHLLVPLTYDTEALVGIAKAANPTLAQTEAEIKALKAESYAILARAVPSVTLSTYVQGTGPDLQNLVKGTYIAMNFQSGLFENLGTAIPLDFKAKLTQIKQKELQLHSMQRDTEQKVIQAYLDSRAAAKSILAAWQELEVSEEAYRLAVGRFQAGLGINVDVLDAQTILSTARTGVAQATLSFDRAQVSLLQSIGQISKDSILTGLKPETAKTYAKAIQKEKTKATPIPAKSKTKPAKSK